MRQSAEATRAHERLLDCARPLSGPLADAIKTVGPVGPPKTNGQGLGHFLSRAIVGQQLSAKAARSIWARVTAAANEANVGVTELAEDFSVGLRECGLSASKVKSLQSIRSAEREGLLCEGHLRKMTPGEIVQRLMTIRGVGPWTCDMAQIFYFSLPDIWPEGDVAVQRTFASLIGRRSPNKAAAKFSPYRSYLALSMWRIVDGGV